MAPVVCATCGGTLHVRTPDGTWRRCTCAQRVLDTLFLKAPIRQGDETFPASYAQSPPLPFTDQLISGDYHAFRHWVWRSLLHYRDARQIAMYDYMDAYRLTEIEFERDELYGRIRDLQPLDLLVLTLGVADAPNRRLKDLVIQILTLRQTIAKPTWLYYQYPDQLREAYSPQLADMLRPLWNKQGPGAKPTRTNIGDV